MGFFDKIRQSDIFIIEDNVQLERQGFTVRNRIKTLDGVRWLSVPIEHTGKPVIINKAKIANNSRDDWRMKHWLAIKHSYGKSLLWDQYSGFFEETYSQEWELLIDLNMHIIKGLMSFLDIKKPLVMASSLGASGNKNELLINQCKALGASVHLSGSGGKDYLDLKRFEKEGIKVVFQEFQHPTYDQPYGSFVPNLSAIDYLFCAGNKGWEEQKIDVIRVGKYSSS